MTTWDLVIPGRPGVKGNSKQIRKTRAGRLFVASNNKDKANENHARASVREQWKGPPLADALRVDVCFSFAVPKSRARRTRAGDWYAQRPDRDNLHKMVADAMSGIVYLDDSQIVAGAVEKRWADIDATHVHITVAQ